ncbi:hypothetical protein KC717_03285, partial [Candidatus Dojkabacteria bacterium]|nr:hypothetical protein [Candidatus Dojkabacteria bacterium]
MKRKIKKKLIFVNSILIGGLFFYVLSLSSVQAATFEFVPSSATFTSCQNTIDIYIDATGEDANAADIEVFFDESKIQITDSSGSIPGTQIIEGVAFEEYMGNYVFNSTGSFFLTGGSYPTTT